MAIRWLDAQTPLPDPAVGEHEQLIAAGLDLSPERLHEAYYKGLFPWFSAGEPVLWWSPDPRLVLFCQDLHVSKSLAKRVRQFNHPDGARRVSLNQAFEQVMERCAAREQTWISAQIIANYSAWHRMGYVHSIESWQGEQLIGGLYGVSLGRCFFGESMFSLASDASKVALVYLVRHLQHLGIEWIDCQQATAHLQSLGAKTIPRSKFLSLLASNRDLPRPAWQCGRLHADGSLSGWPKLANQAI